MRTLNILLFLVSFCSLKAQSDDLQVYVFSGTYQGSNVFVQNPLDKDGIGFSVKYITINNEKTTEQFFSSAFEINLKKYDFPIGETISIKLHYNSDLPPKIVNTEALTATSKISLSKVWMKDDTLLSWCLDDSLSAAIDFVIEQYRWNKWVKLGEVRTSSQNDCYLFDCHLHSGENKFRVVHYFRNGMKISSEVVTTESKTKSIHLKNGNSGYHLEFTEPTNYEIYNENGILLMKGFSSQPNTDHLAYGIYYINLDNKTEIWEKI